MYYRHSSVHHNIESTSTFTSKFMNDQVNTVFELEAKESAVMLSAEDVR